MSELLNEVYISEISDTNKNIDKEYNELTNHINKSSFKSTITLNNLLEQNKLIETMNHDKNLKKGNIICSVDNYKINSNGCIIINFDTDDKNKKRKFKTIPFKSYIWLFKNSTNNRLVLNNILPNNYRGDFTKFISRNEKLLINDSHVKKQINLCESNIKLKSEYDIISSFGFNQLKYISYNNINLIEINERILEIMREYITTKQLKYSFIIEKIFNNKYSYAHKKILLIFNFERKEPKIKIVSNEIKNFEDLLNKYKTKKELKGFLIQQSK